MSGLKRSRSREIERDLFVRRALLEAEALVKVLVDQDRQHAVKKGVKFRSVPRGPDVASRGIGRTQAGFRSHGGWHRLRSGALSDTPRLRVDGRGSNRWLRKSVATRITTEPAPTASEQTSSEPVITTLRLYGNIPSEAWNRFGTKALPKLRGNGELRLNVECSVTLSSEAARNLAKELKQILSDLGLENTVKVENAKQE